MKPTDAILVMKVGFHGHEALEAIVRRKRAEESLLGRTYWGYGGTLCHPGRSVQPFARQAAEAGRAVTVLFASTPSPFYGDPSAATEYSTDGAAWEPVPAGARITASRYALVLRNLRECDETLDLGGYLVANGPSAGRRLSDYLRYRADKAVAVANPEGSLEPGPSLKIALTAELAEPYAIYLRGQP